MNEIKIGKRIAQLRRMNGLTQAQLATAVGVTDRAVSKWETEESYPDILLVAAIADVFHVSTDYLLRGDSQIKQRIVVFNGWNQASYDAVNNDYLNKGWKVVDMKLSGDGDGGCIGAAVLEKEFFDE